MYSPGPYIVIRSRKPKHRAAFFIRQAHPNGKFIGKVYGHEGQPAEDNARLFRTAPQTLAALQACERALTLIGDCPALTEAREAIHNATLD